MIVSKQAVSVVMLNVRETVQCNCIAWHLQMQNVLLKDSPVITSLQHNTITSHLLPGYIAGSGLSHHATL